MYIVPKEKPINENLNSYYISIEKMFEHYQGEIGSGGVYFLTKNAEGVVFFDKDDLLDGYYKTGDIETHGKPAIDLLVESTEKQNFKIAVYAIPMDKVYFWANIPGAEVLYKDLNTDFTDLEGLVKKIGSEKLTGYIEVNIKTGSDSGLIFFNNGNMIGGSYSWEMSAPKSSGSEMKALIQKTKEQGGIFQVYKIPMTNNSTESATDTRAKIDEASTVKMLEELLGILERAVAAATSNSSEFSTILKKKFVSKADTYTFLDPFAAEFEYSNRMITYTGSAASKELAEAVSESVREISYELGIQPQFMEMASSWIQKYDDYLSTHEIGF